MLEYGFQFVAREARHGLGSCFRRRNGLVDILRRRHGDASGYFATIFINDLQIRVRHLRTVGENG